MNIYVPLTGANGFGRLTENDSIPARFTAPRILHVYQTDVNARVTSLSALTNSKLHLESF